MNWKQKLAQVPVIGYATRLVLDVIRLPIMRQQMVRDTRTNFELVSELIMRVDRIEKTLQEVQLIIHSLQLDNKLKLVSDLITRVDCIEKTNNTFTLALTDQMLDINSSINQILKRTFRDDTDRTVDHTDTSDINKPFHKRL